MPWKKDGFKKILRDYCYKKERAYPSESHVMTIGIALSKRPISFIELFFDYRICVNSEFSMRCALIITPDIVLP